MRRKRIKYIFGGGHGRWVELLFMTYELKTIPTLQKQVGCFNYRVISLVADKLERQWLWEVHFCFLKAGIGTNLDSELWTRLWT